MRGWRIDWACAVVLALTVAAAEPASGQAPSDTEKSSAEITRLYQAGKYAEAIRLAKLVLALREKALGPDHLEVHALLNNLASMYLARGGYAEAEPLYKRSLALIEKALGPEHFDVSTALNNLAALHRAQGRFAEAELYYKRSLSIRERALGPGHAHVGTLLNNLAALYGSQGRYAEAEPLYKRSLSIREKALGPEHLDVGASLNNLAALYQVQGRHNDAEPFYRRALSIHEAALGSEHPSVGAWLNVLAEMYRDQGRYTEAEPLYKRSLSIREKALGPEHLDVGTSLNNLAVLYQGQGRYAEAEPLYKRSLALRERVLGSDHPYVGVLLNNLAALYQSQGRYAEAEPLYKRSLALHEKALGPEHPAVGTSLNNLAELYRGQGRYAEAEPLYKRGLALREKVLGPEHPDVGTSLNNQAEMYQGQGRYAEAEPLYKRSLALREKALGPKHPDVGTSLNNLAALYQRQGRYVEAEALFKRVLALREQALRPEHPDIGTSLNNLAVLYQHQGRYAEAEPLYKRGLALREKALGPEHPNVGASLNNLAALYVYQRRYPEAEPLYMRSLALHEKALGPEHPDVGTSLNNLATLYKSQGRYAEAEPLYKRSLALREKALGPEHPEVGHSLNDLAGLFESRGSFAEAEPLYKRSLALREKTLGPAHLEVGHSLNNLAGLYKDWARYAEAELLYKRSLLLQEEAVGSEHPGVGTTLNNLAVLALDQGNYAEAVRYWRRAAGILQHRVKRGLDGAFSKGTGWANNLYVKGLVKTTHRLWAEGRDGPRTPDPKILAAEMFETAQWSQRSEAAASLTQMAARSAVALPAVAALVRERQDLVVEWQVKDKLLIAAISEPPAKRDGAGEKVMFDRLNDIDNRLAALDDLLAKDFPDYAALARPTPIRVAEVQVSLRDDEALIQFLDTAEFTPLAEETFVWVVTKTDVRWVRSAFGTAALLREVAALRCGLDAAAWDGNGTVRCAELLNLPLDKAPDGAQLPFDLARAHSLYKRLLGGAVDLIRGKQLLIVPSGPLTTLPFQVLVTSLPGGVEAGAIPSKVGRLGAELGPLTDAERLRLPTGTVGGVKVIRSIPGGPAEAAELRAGDLLLAVSDRGFQTVPEAVAAIQAAGPDRAVSLTLVRDGRRLALPVTLGAGTVTNWKPLFVDAASAKDVPWLIREHAITVLPSVASLTALRRIGKPSAALNPMIGFGNPLLDGPDGRFAERARQARAEQVCRPAAVKRVASQVGLRRSVAPVATGGGLASVAELRALEPLPETAGELCAVANDLGADVRQIRLGASATETEIKRLSAAGDLARYKIVHFATHGTLAGQLSTTAEPGLVLTPPDLATTEDDGYLSGSEIASLKLDADWVILSACNTAGGADEANAEALSGLARVFFYAGARALLVSHWEVYSDATVKLITTAVKAITQDKTVGRAEALRRAMIAMIDDGKPQEAHPSYWAPFVVVGEGGPER